MTSPDRFPTLALPVRPPYYPLEALAVGELPSGEGWPWQPLEPRLVCEVRYDHFSGRRFRHGAKFLRWRPDKDPRLCTFPQIEGGADRGLEEFWSQQRAG